MNAATPAQSAPLQVVVVKRAGVMAYEEVAEEFGERCRVHVHVVSFGDEGLHAAHFGAAAHFDERDLFSVELALEEALVNAIKHGNQLQPEKKVRVAYSVSSERFDILIEDEGEGFCPDDVPDPTLPENLARPCGRGLLLIRSFMTSVDYQGRVLFRG